jgi:uncharacterized membrane protein YfcA
LPESIVDLAQLDLAYLLPFIAVGFAAQLVDGALGMAFGVISNTLLVAVLGVPPALASQRVNIVQCFTSAVGGISHLLHRNIDARLFFRLLVPALLGGFIGVNLITTIDGSKFRPVVLTYLLGIALYILWKGLRHVHVHREPRTVAPLGAIGGFLSAIGGGGWGPVVTSNLLIQGAEPRKVVGTVNTVEFFLTLTISAAFIWRLGLADLAGATLGLLIGGILAAPAGAWAARHFNPRTMLVLVGIVLTLTSSYGIYKALS